MSEVTYRLVFTGRSDPVISESTLRNLGASYIPTNVDFPSKGSLSIALRYRRVFDTENAVSVTVSIAGKPVRPPYTELE